MGEDPKKIAAFFDIDGTLFRDSLLTEHFKKLTKYEMIDESIWVNDLKGLHLGWLKRRDDYDNYLTTLSENYVKAITGFSKKYLEFTADQVIKTKGDIVYKYTKNMIKWHKENGHLVFFVSGSPDYLVNKMGEKYGVFKAIGSKYVLENGLFTGEVIPMWDSESKDKKINELVKKHNIDLEKSYAYGDTKGDLKMLSKVAHPIAINPSLELIKELTQTDGVKEKVKIVLERKDVVYEIENISGGLNLNILDPKEEEIHE